MPPYPTATIWRKAEEIPSLPAPDPLLHDAAVTHTGRYSVLGVELDFGTNASILAELAEEIFGNWPVRDPAAGRKTLRVFLHDAPEIWPTGTEPVPIFRAQGEYFLLSVGASLGFADRAAGFAAAFITPSLLTEPTVAQVYFLECLGIYLVARERPALLHAAAVVYRDRCILLTGRQGVGKSTLAYACLRAGFQLVTEDIVSGVEREGRLEAWGNPVFLHLLPDAVRLFSELKDAPCVRQLNGERKLRVKVRAIHPNAAVPCSVVWGVCSLSRTPGAAPALCEADPAEVLSALVSMGDHPMVNRKATTEAAQRLLRGPIAHLEIGEDLNGAMEALRRWVESA